MSTRVRFAPSPTGFLHIGGARTALFNWLFARATGGKFLLRIEDTDRERSEDRFTADIMGSLKWLGMDWDEEPIYQSKRIDRHVQLAEELVAKRLAYRCDCTPETLDAIRAQCEKDKRPFRYPGTCREKKVTSSNAVVRVKVPATGETRFKDLIRGEIGFQNKDIDDWVILRGTGAPTYNFSVVIDDYDMKITHVLRGDDHINNTPKQILLYQSLGFAVPNFAHLPMILGADRTKLSKRHGAASTLEYRSMGYLPLSIVNFLARLGWSHGDQEIFTLEELKKHFSLDKIGKSNAIFNQDKLNWVSGHFMRETKASELQAYLREHFSEQLAFAKGVDDARLGRGISIIQAKVKTILELIDQLKCLFGEDPQYSVETIKGEDRTRMHDILSEVSGLFEGASFAAPELESSVRAAADKRGLKLSPFAQALRFAVTGGKISPGLFEMLEVQGKDVVLRRMKNAIRALA